MFCNSATKLVPCRSRHFCRQLNPLVKLKRKWRTHPVRSGVLRDVTEEFEMSVFFLFGIHRECFVNRFSSFGSVPRVDNQCSVQRVSYKVTKQIRCDGKGRKREDEKTYQLQRILKGSRLREFLVDKQCTRRRPIRNTQSQ